MTADRIGINIYIYMLLSSGVATYINTFNFAMCNIAKCIVTIVSRLFGITAVCIILFSFVARYRKSYWNGCIKATIILCQQFFFNFNASNFPFKNPFKKYFKIVFFFALSSRSDFGAAISDTVIVFRNSISADRIVTIVTRLLGAAIAYIMRFSFADGYCTWYWNGEIKIAILIYQYISQFRRESFSF